MVELKDRTLEELRKMASRKKIEGRSKMNKGELVRALKKGKSKKMMKRRKMRGGALTEAQINMLVERNYVTNPMTVRYIKRDGSIDSERQIGRILRTIQDPNMIVIQKILPNGTISNNLSSTNKKFLTISEDGNTLIVDVWFEIRGLPAAAAAAAAAPPSNLVNINTPNHQGVHTHNDGQCAICYSGTRFKKADGEPFNEEIDNASQVGKIAYTNAERRANLVKLAPCGHVFHRGCIATAIAGGRPRICPICRRPFRV